MAPSALIAQLLRALGYPAVAAFNARNQSEVQELVNWLENMKIRQYPEDAREHMRSTDPEAWAAALRKYLVDLECPLELDSASDAAVLRWLLMRAVGEEYRDQEIEAQKAVDGALRNAQPLHAWSEQQLPALADLPYPAVQAALREVLAMLRLDAQQAAEPAEVPIQLGGLSAPALRAPSRAGGPHESESLPANPCRRACRPRRCRWRRRCWRRRSCRQWPTRRGTAAAARPARQ